MLSEHCTFVEIFVKSETTVVFFSYFSIIQSLETLKFLFYTLQGSKSPRASS
jgi:hypothetical protein